MQHAEMAKIGQSKRELSIVCRLPDGQTAEWEM